MPQGFFEYEEETDTVKAINETGIDKFVEDKCRARKDRDKKKEVLKNKLIDQVRQIERRKRGLSTSSVTSIAWSESSARVRARSVESDGGGDSKHSRVSLNQSIL